MQNYGDYGVRGSAAHGNSALIGDDCSRGSGKYRGRGGGGGGGACQGKSLWQTVLLIIAAVGVLVLIGIAMTGHNSILNEIEDKPVTQCPRIPACPQIPACPANPPPHRPYASKAYKLTLEGAISIIGDVDGAGIEPEFYLVFFDDGNTGLLHTQSFNHISTCTYQHHEAYGAPKRTAGPSYTPLIEHIHYNEATRTMNARTREHYYQTPDEFIGAFSQAQLTLTFDAAGNIESGGTIYLFGTGFFASRYFVSGVQTTLPLPSQTTLPAASGDGASAASTAAVSGQQFLAMSSDERARVNEGVRALSQSLRVGAQIATGSFPNPDASFFRIDTPLPAVLPAIDPAHFNPEKLPSFVRDRGLPRDSGDIQLGWQTFSLIPSLMGPFPDVHPLELAKLTREFFGLDYVDPLQWHMGTRHKGFASQIGFPPLDADTMRSEDLEYMRRAAVHYGVQYGYLMVDFYTPVDTADPVDRARGLAGHSEMLCMAEQIGALGIRVNMASQITTDNPAFTTQQVNDAIQNTVDGMSALVAVAKPKGLRVLVETHSPSWSSMDPEYMRRVIEGVAARHGPGHFGVMLDTGNLQRGDQQLTQQRTWENLVQFVTDGSTVIVSIKIVNLNAAGEPSNTNFWIDSFDENEAGFDARRSLSSFQVDTLAAAGFAGRYAMESEGSFNTVASALQEGILYHTLPEKQLLFLDKLRAHLGKSRLE